MNGLAPGEAVEITESAGEIGRSDRWRTALCLALSRARLESSLRIPGQRRGWGPFQLQAGQGRGRRRRSKESSGAPITMWNRVSKKEGRNGETVEAEAMNGGGPARASSCRFRRTRELLCARAEIKCLDAGTLSEEGGSTGGPGLAWTFLKGTGTA